VIEALGLFITILAVILLIAIFARIILSLTGFDPNNPLSTVLHEITEPILAPIRQFMPRIGMFDLSPMVASFLLILVIQAAQRLLAE
jgi:YggT family protein